uniref:Uncharacterized protein n=1 Tax=Vitis vinifera TaxID=29760 RepID=A5AFQ6_VITVI|nr:hypothetical protein VITISV_032488 [Vitis vinifera]
MWVSQAVGGISLGVAVGMRRQQAEEKGKLPLVSRISLSVVGHRRDLCECRCYRRPSAGSVLDPWCRGWDVDDGRRRKGWSLEVAATQPRDLILLNRTPK